MASNKKKQAQPTPRKETITPAVAKKMLESNDNNRSLSAARSAFYAEQMAEDKWPLTDGMICIDVNGNLLNGQHRLTACVMANVPFTTWVLRGMDPSLFSKIDQGATRSGSDIIGIAGFKFSTLAAAAARVINGLEGWEQLSDDDKAVNLPDIGVRLTMDQILDIVRRNAQNIEYACRIVKSNRHATSVCTPPSVFVGVYCYIINAGARKAMLDAFYSGVASGLDIHSHNDPIARLRSYTQQAGSSKMGKSSRVRQRHVCAVIIKAWNAHVAKSEVRNLKYSDVDRWPTVRKR